MDPVPPGQAISVIPTTGAQVKRSANYTWLLSLALGIPGTLVLIGNIAPDVVQPLSVLFPKYKEIIVALGSIAASVGAALLAKQRQNSAKDETPVIAHPSAQTPNETGL